MAHSIQYHYPNVKQLRDGRPVCEYLATKEQMAVPFLQRPAVARLRNTVRKTHRVVVVAFGEVIAPTADGYQAARREIQSWGGELVSSVESDEEHVRELFQDPRIQNILARVPERYPVHVAPTTYPLTDAAPLSLHSVQFDGTIVTIHLKHAIDLTDIAHEITHVPMILDGYGVIIGASESPYAFAIQSAILDVEVDRRVAEAGFDPATVTDSHMSSRAQRSLLSMNVNDVLAELIMRPMLETHTPAARDNYVERLRRFFPNEALAADRIIAACGGPNGLRNPSGANAGLSYASMVGVERGEPAFDVHVFEPSQIPGQSGSGQGLFVQTANNMLPTSQMAEG